MIRDMGTTITLSDGHTIPLERLEAHNATQARAAAEAIERARKQAEKAPKGICPFSTAANGTCRSDCALLTDGRCSLRREATADTAGRRCPFTRTKCAEHCALFCGGCSITTIFKGMKPGKE